MKKNNILMIEDSIQDIELTKEALEGSPMLDMLVFVHDGDDAIRYLEMNLSPDIIILDLNLPGMNGKDVLANIKSNEATKKIPVIIMSTTDSESEIKKCYELHANCFIIKPMDFSDLKEVMKSIEGFWFNTVTLSSLGE